MLSTTSDGTLNFSGAFANESFVFSSDGSVGTDVSLATSADATLADLGHDLRNFVGDEHGVLKGDGWMLSTYGLGSGLTLHTDPPLLAWSGHGFSANALTDYGVAHAVVMLR